MSLDTNLNNILVESLNDEAFLKPFFVMASPFLDRLAKETAGGSGYRIPIQTGKGGGRGSDFSKGLARAAMGGFTSGAFVPVPAWAYGHSTIDWSQQPYSTTPQSPVDISMTALKNSMEGCREDLLGQLMSPGHGVLATILSNTNTSGNIYKLVLSTATDASKFQIDDVLKSKASVTATSFDASTAKITGVNEIEGSILVDGGGSWTPTNGHVIGLDGELDISASVTGFAGPFAWCPPITSRTNGVVGDTFLGVPRTISSQVVATSGWAFDGRGLPLLQVINVAGAQMARYNVNAAPKVAYCAPTAAAKLAIETNQQVRYDMPSKSGVAEVFYGGFTIVTAAGKMEVVIEPHFPADQVLLSGDDAWVYASPNGSKLFGPATNGKVLVDAYGVTEGNVSRASVMSTGFFGGQKMASVANILINPPNGLNV